MACIKFFEAIKQLLQHHITSVVKPVHTFIASNRLSKNCLMDELCFHRFVHFGSVPSTFTTSNVLAIRMTSLL